MNMGQRNLPSSVITVALCLVAGAAMLPAGCSMPVSVSYSPLAATETLFEGPDAPHVYVMKFDDAREDKENIGRMRNILGGTEKYLTTSDDFGVVLAEATTDALRKSGVRADLHLDRTTGESIPDKERKNYDYLVGGKMTRVDVVSHPGLGTVRIKARLVIELYVSDGSRGEWIGPIEGTAEKREIQALLSHAYTLALDGAMQNCMRNLARHLKASGAMQRVKK